MAERAPASGEAREENGRLAVGTLTYLGFGLQLVQVGLLPLLPSIGRQMHTSPAGTSWILISGLISGAVFLAVFTRLADLIGKKPVIVLSMALVLVGCVLGSAAHGFGLLILGRVLIGAQLPMLALPEAIASDTMQPRRAHTAISAIHSGTGLGVAAGLLLGALMGFSASGWRWYFVVGAVVSLVGLVATLAWVRDSPARASGGLDVPGAVLLTVSLVALLLGLSQGPAWGWASPRVLGLLVGGVAVALLWWRWECRAQVPLIEVAYLTRLEVALPYAMTLLMAFGVYGALSAVTRLAQTPVASGFGYGWSALGAGWFALPQALGSLVGLCVLRAARPRGLVFTSAIGFTLIAIGFAGFGVGHGLPLVMLVALGFDSAGLAIGLAATQLLVVRSVPADESGIALGISVVMYAVGNSLGTAVAAALFASFVTPTEGPALAGYLAGFATCGVCAVLALVLCVPLGRQRHRATPALLHG